MPTNFHRAWMTFKERMLDYAPVQKPTKGVPVAGVNGFHNSCIQGPLI